MYHFKTDQPTTSRSPESAHISGTGTATARALATLFMPSAFQLFMPVQQKIARVDNWDTAGVSLRNAIAAPEVGVVALPSSEHVPMAEIEIPGQIQAIEVTNENAGTIKAAGMLHHLRHTKN